MARIAIFDFDGTLGDTKSMIVGIFHKTVAQLGLEPRSDEEYAATIGLPLKEAFLRLYDIGEDAAAAYTDAFRNIEISRPLVVPSFPHVKETLDRLRDRGVVLTIATSRRRQSLIEFLENMGLSDYFSYLVSSIDVERSKPAPDMVLKTLGALNADADDAIVIGDTSYDIEMGRSAGATTVGVTYGIGSRAELIEARADFLVDDFELLEYII